MIKTLTNITSKSFEHFSSENELSKINIFFGMNGSGKSALAEWLYQKNKERSRYFNTKYVNENVELIDSQGISGVKLTIGKDEIDSNREIINLENDVSKITEQLKNLEKDRKENKNELYNLIDGVIKKIKEDFPGVNIHHKPNSRDNPVSALKSWKKDRSTKFNNVVGQTLKDLNIQKVKEEKNLENLQPICDKFTTDTFDNLNKELAKKTEYLNESQTNELLIWLKKGLDIHELDDSAKGKTKRCKFCDNEFNSEQVLSKIKKFYNNEYSKLIMYLNDVEKSIPDNEQIKKNQNFVDDETLIIFNNALIKLTKIIEQKRKKPLSELKFSNQEIIDFLSLDKKIKESRNEKQEQLDKINKIIMQFEEYAKNLICKELELDKDNKIKEATRKINNNEKSIQTCKDTNEKKTEEIKKLQENKSVYNGFKEIVNEELSNLGAEFSLELLENKEGYVLKHNNPKVSLQITDLSEGERRIFAFFHFYYDLFFQLGNQEEKIDSTIDTIIIDDPITSFDSDNRFFLIERINIFLKTRLTENVQVFILTHSSFDFHSFGYSLGSEKTNWKIFKDTNGNSQIKKVDKKDLRNYSDYYSSTFCELADFSKFNRTEINECSNFVKYGNQMRFIIESNARSNYNVENVTGNSVDKLIEYYEVETNIKADFEQSIDVINSLSHGRSYYDEQHNEITARELQHYIRIILTVLFNKDQNHVRILTNEKLSKKIIKNWNII